MTRRKARKRSKVLLLVGVGVTLTVAGLVAAPFASASAQKPVAQKVAVAQKPAAADRKAAAQKAAAQKAADRKAAIRAALSKATANKALKTTGKAASTAKSGCNDVELLFARGTGDIPDLGILGSPLGQKLTAKLKGKSVKAVGVDYAADFSQASAGPGATTMTKDLTATAAQCADTQFIIGGYSQGASVTDIAVGANGAQSLGRGTAIPANLASRIKAVVVFGNPLSGFAGSTLEKASATFGARTKSFCGTSDPICGGDRNGNGNVSGNHLSYTTNGALDQAATFAAGKITG